MKFNVDKIDPLIVKCLRILKNSYKSLNTSLFLMECGQEICISMAGYVNRTFLRKKKLSDILNGLMFKYNAACY